MSEKLGDGLNERVRERMGERFGLILCTRLYEMLDPNLLQVYFRQAARSIQKSVKLSWLPSPDESLVLLRSCRSIIHKLFQILPGMAKFQVAGQGSLLISIKELLSLFHLASTMCSKQ